MQRQNSLDSLENMMIQDYDNHVKDDTKNENSFFPSSLQRTDSLNLFGSDNSVQMQ